MAAFKEHVTFSTVLGIGYAAASWHLGVEWSHATLAGVLCGVSGMLPDLDSASGKPIRELFGLTAAVVPMVLMRGMRESGLTPELCVLIALAIYIAIRFGASWLLKRLTVHRGMFHSIPAAIIAAEIALLAHHCGEDHGELILAGGVLLGFLSHLVLDEVYSVDFQGLSVRLNKSAGTALKLFSPSVPATLFTWCLLAGLTYAVCVNQGLIESDPLGSLNLQAIRTHTEGLLR